MNQADLYFDIRDSCRKGLLPFMDRALDQLPSKTDPRILDIGCGSGVPSIHLAEQLGGTIDAVDMDTALLNRLNDKIRDTSLNCRIKTRCGSVFSLDLAKGSYDLVLAEGFLNMVGFEKGMTRILPLLKERGFLILHDEEKNQAEKEILIQQMGGQILDSFVLDPTIWWQHYYQCLDQAIASIEDEDIRKLFCGDLKEIAAYRKDPAAFRSRYSVIQKII